MLWKLFCYVQLRKLRLTELNKLPQRTIGFKNSNLSELLSSWATQPINFISKWILVIFGHILNCKYTLLLSWYVFNWKAAFLERILHQLSVNNSKLLLILFSVYNLLPVYIWLGACASQSVYTLLLLDTLQYIICVKQNMSVQIIPGYTPPDR